MGDGTEHNIVQPSAWIGCALTLFHDFVGVTPTSLPNRRCRTHRPVGRQSEPHGMRIFPWQAPPLACFDIYDALYAAESPVFFF